MKIEKYRQLTTEDFLEEEYFRQWVLQSDHETDEFWKRFLTTFPEKEREVQEARHILKSLYVHFETEVRQVPKEQAKASFRKVAEKNRTAK